MYIHYVVSQRADNFYLYFLDVLIILKKIFQGKKKTDLGDGAIKRADQYVQTLDFVCEFHVCMYVCMYVCTKALRK